jgi:hypothetical protein
MLDAMGSFLYLSSLAATCALTRTFTVSHELGSPSLIPSLLTSSQKTYSVTRLVSLGLFSCVGIRSATLKVLLCKLSLYSASLSWVTTPVPENKSVYDENLLELYP